MSPDERLNVARLFLERAARHADLPAVCTASDELRWGELRERALATADALATLSPRRTGVFVRGPLDYAVAFWGALLAGAPACLIAPDVPEAGVAAICGRVGLDVLLADRDLGPIGGVRRLEPSARGRAAPPGDPPGVARGPDDFAAILLTSGTTGAHKAVPVTHRNLAWTGRAFNEILGLSEGHRELTLVPLTHSFGMRRLVAQMLAGGAIHVIEGAFHPERAFELLERAPCDVLAAVPAHIRLLLRFAGDFARAAVGLRHIELSSQPMSVEEKVALVRTLPRAAIVMGYGLTEATRTCLLRLDREPGKLATSGRPFPSVEVRIADEDGRSLPPGREGEIRVAGPNVAPGYLEGFDLDRRRFEGGFATGDLGSIDADGYLTVLGRTDDIINVGGRKLHPLDLEGVLAARFPGVDCAVARVRDPLVGTRPVLCTAGGGVDPEALMAALRESVEGYKLPARVVALPAIPRTANGKVRRGELQALVDGAAVRPAEGGGTP